LNKSLCRACTGVYERTKSEKAFTCVLPLPPPSCTSIHKIWFFGHTLMSWFNYQWQLLQNRHWKLRKSSLSVSITNLLLGCHLLCLMFTNVSLGGVQFVFLFLFQTDLAGPRKNVNCWFVIQPILTELKINKVLPALSTNKAN
jgi:hypothetical protein